MSNYIYVILHSSNQHGDSSSLVCTFSEKKDADEWLDKYDYYGNYHCSRIELDNINHSDYR